jgi:hypothetical protein
MYKAAKFGDGMEQSVWLMVFYGSHAAFAHVHPSKG